MTALKSLTFTALPRPGASPVLNRRTTIIARLEEQKLLLADPSYIRVSQRWTKKDGERVPVERRQRVTPWWRVDQSGAYLLFIRSGGNPRCRRAADLVSILYNGRPIREFETDSAKPDQL
jgi:hypothetical protein